jgi:hypothetical protein
MVKPDFIASGSALTARKIKHAITEVFAELRVVLGMHVSLRRKDARVHHWPGAVTPRRASGRAQASSLILAFEAMAAF